MGEFLKGSVGNFPRAQNGAFMYFVDCSGTVICF